MHTSWLSGVRVGALTVDPEGRAPIAFFTHRGAHRPPAGLALAHTALAATWSGVQGLPYGAGAVAAGMRLELLPTGYGPGGAAALLAEDGYRVLVVGPTTETLTPRAVDDLVIFAPAPPSAPPGWLEAAAEAAAHGEALRLLAPDGGAMEAIAAALTEAGIPHRRPTWLPGGRKSSVQVVPRGVGRLIDLRPVASPAWLVEFARACHPERVSVHGPAADAVARGLTEAGLNARVIQAPAQLVLAGMAAHE